MTVPSEHDCRYTRWPVCPYCSFEDDGFWEVSGDSGSHQCGSCSRAFLFERTIEVTYTTDPIVGPHELSEFEQQEELLGEQDDA